MKHTKKPKRTRSVYARDLRTPKYKPKVIPNKKKNRVPDGE